MGEFATGWIVYFSQKKLSTEESNVFAPLTILPPTGISEPNPPNKSMKSIEPSAHSLEEQQSVQVDGGSLSVLSGFVPAVHVRGQVLRGRGSETVRKRVRVG